MDAKEQMRLFTPVAGSPVAAVARKAPSLLVGGFFVFLLVLGIVGWAVGSFGGSSASTPVVSMRTDPRFAPPVHQAQASSDGASQSSDNNASDSSGPQSSDPASSLGVDGPMSAMLGILTGPVAKLIAIFALFGGMISFMNRDSDGLRSIGVTLIVIACLIGAASFMVNTLQSAGQ